MMSSGRIPRLSILHHRGSGTAAILLLGLRDGVLGGAVGQAHAQGFDGAGHGVGRIHAAAGTRPGNRARFNRRKFLIARSCCLACAPTASKTETMSSLRVSPVMQPGRIVPP